MTRLIAAEFRKLVTTRLWLWMLLVSAALTQAVQPGVRLLTPWPGGVVFATWAAAFAAAGTIRTIRRDIT